MLDQGFSPRCLLKLVRREDVVRYRLWQHGDDRDAVMRSIADSVNAPNFVFPTFREKKMKGKTVCSAPDATTMLALRKLDRNMRSIYKVKQANRDDMVHQVKSLLQEGCTFTVLRLDIRSFYESVNSAKVLEQIAQDSMLSYTSRVLLRKLFETPQLSGQPGLPRGLGVSATLAELSARGPDRHIRSCRHIYFYGRYVDDIIVFTHATAADAEEDVRACVDRVGLALNPDKRAVVVCYGPVKPRGNNASDGFDFLGYHFETRRYLDKKGTWRNVCVRIAPSKVKKLKSRIVHALIDYTASRDFPLLLKRMRFLAGNYVLRGRAQGGLCGGLG